MTSEELEAKGYYRPYNDCYILNLKTGEVYISLYIPYVLNDDDYTYYSLDGIEYFPYNGLYSNLEFRTKKNIKYVIEDLSRRIFKKKEEIEILNKLVIQLEKLP